MSKIQDALEKIKNNTPKNNSKLAETYDNSDGNLGAEFENANLDNMYQPEVFSFEEKVRKRLLDPAMADKKLFDAFRSIRTTLNEKMIDTCPIIMVTSCTEQAGTSFVCANLAVSIALDEFRTSLLLDCNISKPSLDYLLAGTNHKGLVDYLKNSEVKVEDIVIPTGIPRMRVIPAGSVDQQVGEIFTSTKLKALFSELKNKYNNRHIIVDAPPTLEHADARIISQACDYIVLVVEYGHTSVKQLKNAVHILGSEKILGVIINNEPRLPVILSDS